MVGIRLYVYRIPLLLSIFLLVILCYTNLKCQPDNFMLNTTYTYNLDSLIPDDSIKGVVVVAHGLNTKPHIMDSIIQALLKMKLESFLVSLSGHYPESQPIDSITFEQWPDDFQQVYFQAKQKANSLRIPLYFIGFSLGALIGEYMINQSNGVLTFSKQILLAPAIATRSRASIIKTSFFLPDTWKLPSYTPEPYKANSELPIKAYKFLFQYQDSIMKNHFKYLNIPTLIMIDPDDELISLHKLKKFNQNYDLTNFSIIELSSSMDDRNYRYHHLIVDKLTMGIKNWNLFITELQSFFFNN